MAWTELEKDGGVAAGGDHPARRRVRLDAVMLQQPFARDAGEPVVTIAEIGRAAVRIAKGGRSG